MSVCILECPNGMFALPGMRSCHPLLTCDTKIKLITTISTSVVKTVYLAEWENHEVVLSVLSKEEYEEDFKQNLFMIKSFNGKNTVQLIGFCNNNILTKYYALGNALNVNYHLRNSLKAYDSVNLRLDLCINYVNVINFLHTSPVGTRVMCDSNTLEKTLSQFLLTDDLNIIANDLDATPEVDKIKKGILCGNRALIGSFVAPEQLWPYGDQKYDPEKMPLYDEKTDVWKIPDICNWFLGGSSEADILKYKLFNFHKTCKNRDPSKRPSAALVLEMYKNVRKELLKNV
ncbi:Protein O-mannose kinase like protein [Argiope bruennichi]|uniref:Protein O-mannose kinase n=2 Tax=Argiope bruennichi TaxID=94029 RepID=A0A8T0F6C9_ARGBR|nr:Protein O-mannose kinase like protein [Argiope bruennichi]